MKDIGFEDGKLIHGWIYGRGFYPSQAHYTTNVICKGLIRILFTRWIK